MSSSPSLPAADCKALYGGIITCRDTVQLLSLFALNEGSDNENLSLMLGPLELMERRLGELALLVDPGVLFNRAKIMEESHV